MYLLLRYTRIIIATLHTHTHTFMYRIENYRTSPLIITDVTYQLVLRAIGLKMFWVGTIVPGVS